MKVVWIRMEEARLRLMEEVWSARENDQDSCEKANKARKIMLAWL